MKSHYRAVVIGGGVVGTSVLYHLARGGWSDVLLIERSVLTAGSSWHAAGGIHALNADPNIAALQAYTIDLLPEIEAESGQDIGLHMSGGLTLATTDERWTWLRAQYDVFQTMGIEDCRLVDAEECRELVPIMAVDDVRGALWADREGHVDTTGTVHAYARAARRRGAEIIEHNRVLALKPHAEGWEIQTEQGAVICEHVINAAGLWAKQLGRMAGIELPVAPLAHHYLITEAIPELIELERQRGHPIPMVMDPEGFTYSRQDQQGMLVGIYERNVQHWMLDGAPWDYGIELLPEDIDRIGDELAAGFTRFPVLEHTGIRRWVNGAFTFSPDGNPLVGPVPGVRNYWCACAVMAGFLQGGGVGKSLAEWMIEGEAEADIFGMDVARYGEHASNREYIRQTTGQFYSRRFLMNYPNEQLPAGRPCKLSPAHGDLEQAGARFGVSYGLEVPLYFAPAGFEETPSLLRSNATPYVAEECRAVREQAGLIDSTGFSRFEVSGADAAGWLNHLLACRMPAPGRVRLAPMLATDGRLKGDLTILNWGDGSYWLMGSYYLRAWHRRWFLSRFDRTRWPNVTVNDIADKVCGFVLTGPSARTILEPLVQQDISNAAFRFMACQDMDVDLYPCRVARLSVCGELGYEINVRASQHAALRRSLLRAGADKGLREFGSNALLSLRMEKSFGIWSAEFTQDRSPGMVGLERFIDFDKGAFIGRDAALACYRDPDGPERVIATLAVDAPIADAIGFEPVYKKNQRIGFVTSGAYGHTVGTSLAMALLDREYTLPGTELTVNIVGEPCAARVLIDSPYDPDGKAMRS